MKIKKEYLILALIIAGLLVYLFLRERDRTLYELPVLPEVSKKEITKIEITKGSTSIVLHKKDDRWYIGPRQYPADQNKIKAMLDVFEDLTLTTPVSESQNYVRYELNDENKINAKAWQADKLQRNFDIGKTASTFRHTFVKIAEDDRVFHARNNFRNAFDQAAENLRDKVVLSFQISDISGIEIKQEQTALALTRTQIPVQDPPDKNDQADAATSQPVNVVWQSADGKTGDDTKITRLLSTLSNLRCEKFIEDRQKEDFTAAVSTIQVKGAQNYRLSIFAKLNEEDSNYPAISSGSDYPFLLSQNTVDRIIKSPENLLEKPKMDETKSEAEKSESKP